MFVKATREKIALKLAITGPSGSGKSMSALRLAAGLGRKIAVIDTENGSASLYADTVEFDVAVLSAPYTVKKYVAAIEEATAAGYDVIVIDSLSHEWAGEGGLLDQKTAKEAAGKNGFTAWGELGQQHELLKSAILQAKMHIVVTMRSKQDYVLEQGTNGKTTPRKVGMAPIQREGMEYEFTTVWDCDASHRATTSKDRTGLFTDEIEQITEAHGTRLIEWLKTAATPAAPVSVKATADEMKAALKAHALSDYEYAGNVGKLAVALLGYTPDKWTADVYTDALNAPAPAWFAAVESLKPPAPPDPAPVQHSAVVRAADVYLAPEAETPYSSPEQFPNTKSLRALLKPDSDEEEEPPYDPPAAPLRMETVTPPQPRALIMPDGTPSVAKTPGAFA